MLDRSILLIATVLVSCLSVQASGGWVAYNDCLRQGGDSTADNVTGWTIHNNDLTHFTGPLKDFETGSSTGMPIITFTMGGAGLQVSGGGAGGNFSPGTDAYEIFNCIVDFGPDNIYYGSPGWWVEMEFSGLDPKSTYTFVGTANRSRDYPDRISLFTILGAAGFVNNSSPGVAARAGATTKLRAGDNSATGYVVRWDGIVPSADGTFKVRAEAAPESGTQAYPLGGFMLQQTGGAGNRPPEVDAGEYDGLIWPMHTVQLSPVVSDDDPCGLGVLIYRWVQLGGPATVTFDPTPYVENPLASFPAPGRYELRLQVWDELLQEADATVTITVVEPLLGDFNGDNRVNWQDLFLFARQWLDPEGSPVDLNIVHGVDLRDFAMMAMNWRAGEGATLVINEVLARNVLTNKNPQGGYEDWIELYNGGDDSIDLGGMYLTDDPSEPTKWRFPFGNPSLTTIAPGGYLLVWADGDLQAPGLHASFELEAAGEDVALFDTDGVTLLDHIRFEDQTADVSFGREPDGVVNWVTLTPTPGASNDGAFLALVEDTKFSHDRGFYSQPFDVAIGTATEGATIRYTTDGSTPSPSHGTVYTAPVRISTTTTLRAIAYRTGWKSTDVDTHTYIFLDDVIRQATHPVTGAQVTPDGYPTTWPGGSTTGPVPGDYQMDPDIVGQDGKDKSGGLYANTIRDDLKAVPTISLVMDKDDWFGPTGIYVNEWESITERVASFEYIDFQTQESLQANCALAMQGGPIGGGTSLKRWKTFKLSMRPRFKALTDDGKPTGGPSRLDFKLFPDSPVESHNTVVFDAVLNHSWLHSGQHRDVMYIQDQYTADLHNALGGHSPHGFYAHLYINGLYWGMYYIHERPDHAWAAEVFGGTDDEYDALKHNSGGVINDGIGGSATANYNAMIEAAKAVESDPSNMTKYENLCRLLDVDNFIAYLLTNWFVDNGDWPHKNWYATHRNTPDGKWWFHSWDAEHTVEDNSNQKLGQSPSDRPGNPGIHSRLARNIEYRTRFADIAHRALFNGGPLTDSVAGDLYKFRMSQIDRAIVGESARWGDNRQSSPHTRQDWLNAQNARLANFFPGRASFILNWLRNAGLYPNIDAPVFRVNGVAQHGGYMNQTDSLTMAAASGVVYYALDGEDPRLPGGAVNVAHAKQAAAVRLTYSTCVKARALVGATWSAVSEAVFAVGPVAESLRISEIMYHPADTGNPNDPNTEYIELTNVGVESINLNLVRFTDGVDFTFPNVDLAPGGYCLVVKDPAAFLDRYGEELPVVGRYTGSLNNAGERIELCDAAGAVIHDFHYMDDWFDITDGTGFSLTVRNPGAADANAYDSKSLWRPSARMGGSPGADDSGQVPELGSVVINELLAGAQDGGPDWIELHNTTGQAIDIGGWFLSDDNDNLTKYQIAAGTIIAPRGYIVFSEDLHFGNKADPGCRKSFGLSRDGETVYLHSSSDGVVTGYSEQEEFGASEPGVSLGRWPASAGGYDFVALSEATPGGPNAAPRVDPDLAG